MKCNNPNRLFVLIAVVVLILACSPCGSGRTPAPIKTPVPTKSPSGGGEVWTPAKDITVSVGGSSSSKLEIPAGTKVTPKSAEGKVDLEEISPSDIGTRLPDLPEGKKVLAAVDVTPDGMTFSPPAPLHFALPRGHGYSAGDMMEVMQLDKDSDKWLPAGEAEVDASEKFAIGEIAHTCVFALVESGGSASLDPSDIDSVLAWTTYAALSDDVSAIADVIPETGVRYVYFEGPEAKSDTYTLEDIDNLFDDVTCLGLVSDKDIVFAEREYQDIQYLFSFQQEGGRWQLESIELMAGLRAYPTDYDGFSPCPDPPR